MFKSTFISDISTLIPKERERNFKNYRADVDVGSLRKDDIFSKKEFFP